MALKITVSASDPRKFATDLLALGVVEGVRNNPTITALIKKLGADAASRIARADFKGKKGQSCEIAAGSHLAASRVFLVGLGKGKNLKAPELRLAAAQASRAATTTRSASVAIAIPDVSVARISGSSRALAEGLVLGAYTYDRYKTDTNAAKFALGRAVVLTKNATTAHKTEAALGARVGHAVCIARDLVNAPPNELYPEILAKAATDLCKRHSSLSCKVLNAKQLKAKGMLLLDAVGRGSVRGPRFIHMKYTPPGKKKGKLKRLVFVGKGLTFDTGGICLKPAPGMEEMKGDMGGGANIVAFMAAVAETKPNAEIHGLIASAENMPDGNSYRPGDIFGSYLGKTVEIINTDAEGRLALADALAYGAELKPDMMLDNATLTGACVVALGPTVAGYFTNQPALGESMQRAADTAGEAMWQLPLVEELRDKLKSDWADMKHMGDRWGGAITAALFLREFVGDTHWLHVDVAGPSMADKAYGIYSKGGTGAGVLAFLQLVSELTSGSKAKSKA